MLMLSFAAQPEPVPSHFQPGKHTFTLDAMSLLLGYQFSGKPVWLCMNTTLQAFVESPSQGFLVLQ